MIIFYPIKLLVVPRPIAVIMLGNCQMKDASKSTARRMSTM